MAIYANAAQRRAGAKRAAYLRAHPKQLAAGRARAAAIKRQQAAAAAKRRTASAANKKSATAAKNAAKITASANKPQPANPYVEINSNGQLDLPYSTQYSWDVLNKTEEMNQSLLELQQQQQAHQLDYTNTKRDLGQQFEVGQRDTLNNAAARGMARSSLYGNQVGQLATNYNNAVTDLESQNTQTQQGFSLGRTQIQNAFNNMLRQVGLMRAEEASQNAGALGYGKATPKTTRRPNYVYKRNVVRPKPKPKPKSKKKAAKKKAQAKKKKVTTRKLAAKKVVTKRRPKSKPRRRSAIGKRAV